MGLRLIESDYLQYYHFCCTYGKVRSDCKNRQGRDKADTAHVDLEAQLGKPRKVRME